MISLKKLWGKNKGVCHYCRSQITLEEATIDHKIPRAMGGGSAQDNLVLSCFPCNNRKGEIPYDVFLKRIAIPKGLIKDDKI